MGTEVQDLSPKEEGYYSASSGPIDFRRGTKVQERDVEQLGLHSAAFLHSSHAFQRTAPSPLISSSQILRIALSGMVCLSVRIFF